MVDVVLIKGIAGVAPHYEHRSITNYLSEAAIKSHKHIYVY